MERDGPQPERGIVRGRHYTEYVEVVKALKRQGALEEAEALLLEMIEALENESRATGLAFAPWYYEQIAMVRHIKRDFGGEVAIIERCLALYTGPSGPRDALIRRPDRAGESQTRAKREPNESTLRTYVARQDSRTLRPQGAAPQAYVSLTGPTDRPSAPGTDGITSTTASRLSGPQMWGKRSPSEGSSRASDVTRARSMRRSTRSWQPA